MDNYIENYRNNRSSEIDKLKSRISDCINEKEQLEKELNDLLSEKHACDKENEFLEFAVNRVEKAVDIIKITSNKEISDSYAASEQELAEYNKKISRVEEEIVKTKGLFDLYTKKILEVHQEENYNGEPAAEVSQPGQSSCKVYPYLVKPSEDDTIKAAQEKKDAQRAAIQSNSKLISKEAIENDGSFWNLNLHQKTADGTVFSNTRRAVSDDSANDNPHKSGRGSTKKSSKVTGNLNNITPGISSEGYWSDISCMVDSIADNESSYTPEAKKVQKAFTHDTASKTAAAGINTDTAFQPEPRNSEIEFRKDLLPEDPVPADSKNAINEQTGNMSPVSAMEVNALRNKYIVGKLAGEDLYDSAGKTIASKKQVITPEIIEKAEQEGKLSELIINMILPN